MASTISTKVLAVALAVSGVAACVSGCSSPEDTRQPLPVFELEGTMGYRYDGIAELAKISSAVVIVEPTGEGFTRPIPAVPGAAGVPAPVQYVRLTVLTVLDGTVEEATAGEGGAMTIDVVSPGFDRAVSKIGLISGGPYLLFITPAMLGPDDPLGGYVVSGGPTGVFAQTDPKSEGSYDSAFWAENTSLPQTIIVGETVIPRITHTEAELVKIGPQ